MSSPAPTLDDRIDDIITAIRAGIDPDTRRRHITDIEAKTALKQALYTTLVEQKQTYATRITTEGLRVLEHGTHEAIPLAVLSAVLGKGDE